MITETILKIEHIVTTPGIKGGRPRIQGTGIRVQDVAAYYQGGWNAEKIAAELPPLTLAQVHAALSYYFDHQTEIDQIIRDDWAYIEQNATPLSDVIAQIQARQKLVDPAIS